MQDFRDELVDGKTLSKVIKTKMVMQGISVGQAIEAGLNHNFLYNMKVSYPRCDTIYVISRILNCTMESLLVNKEMENDLTPSEIDLIKLFRELSIQDKTRLVDIAKVMKG